MSRASLIRLVIGGMTAVLVLVSGYFLLQMGTHPDTATIRSFLNSQIGGAKVLFTRIDYHVMNKAPGVADLEFTAAGTAPNALFERVDTLQAIQAGQPVNFTVIDEAAKLLNNRYGAQLREWAKLGEPPVDPRSLIVVRQTVAPGGRVVLAGVIHAEKSDRLWGLRLVNSVYREGEPRGEPRDRFPATSVQIDSPTDAQRLATLAAAARDYAAKVVAASHEFAQKLVEERRAAQNKLLQMIKPGELYSGVARSRRSADAVVLYFEFTDFSEQNGTVVASLHNDSGGLESRVFQGTWQMDDEATRLRLRLETNATQAQQNCGPLLGLYQNWTLEFALDESGKLSGGNQDFTYELSWAGADPAKVRAEMHQGHDAAMAATAPGKIYIGNVTNRQTGESDRLLLVFEKQEPRTGAFSGVFQSVDHPGQERRFTGTGIGNKYLSQGLPLRITIRGADGGDNRSFITMTSDWQFSGIGCQLSDDEIRAEHSNFAYAFKLATPQELAEIQARRQAAAEEFFGAFRAGTGYIGTARAQDGFVGRIRLRIMKVDRVDRTITFAIDSRDQPGLYHVFSGGYSVEGRSVVGNSTGDGRYVQSGIRRIPFFSRDERFRMVLRLAESGLIRGELAGYAGNGWTFEFIVGKAGAQVSTAPAATIGDESVPPELRGYPAIPRQEGAYVLAGEQWVALPHNNGKAVTGLAQSVQEIGAAISGLANLLNGKGATPPPAAQNSANAGTVIFDGPDTVPAIAGDNVVLLYLGPVNHASDYDLQEFPQLREYPEVEAAQLRVTSQGQRTGDLRWVVPNRYAGFADYRLPATVVNVSPTVHLLVVSTVLPPGPYCITGKSLYEFRVQ